MPHARARGFVLARTPEASAVGGLDWKDGRLPVPSSQRAGSGLGSEGTAGVQPKNPWTFGLGASEQGDPGRRSTT